MLRLGMIDRLAPYEGLIHATAVRYVGFLDHDLDDTKQLLRIKVWKSLVAYDPQRTTGEENGFVFSCVYNYVKDLLKEQDRLNKRRQGAALYVEDAPGHATMESFERRYLISEDDFASVEDDYGPLPSTLTELERAVVQLLTMDFNQTEIARQLGVTRQTVRSAHAAVREKMADWRPYSAPVVLPVPLAA